MSDFTEELANKQSVLATQYSFQRFGNGSSQCRPEVPQHSWGPAFLEIRGFSGKQIGEKMAGIFRRNNHVFFGEKIVAIF